MGVRVVITALNPTSRDKCFDEWSVIDVCNQRLIGVTYPVPDLSILKDILFKLMLGNQPLRGYLPVIYEWADWVCGNRRKSHPKVCGNLY